MIVEFESLCIICVNEISLWFLSDDGMHKTNRIKRVYIYGTITLKNLISNISISPII